MKPTTCFLSFRSGIAFAVAALLLATGAHAQRVATVKIGQNPARVGQAVDIQVFVPVGPTRADAICAVDIAFGDGRAQESRVASSAPAIVTHTYTKEGTYSLVVLGKTMYRGLGTTWGCDGDPVTAIVTVVSGGAPASDAAPGVPGVEQPTQPSFSVIAPQPSAPATPANDAEEETWQIAKRVNTVGAYQAYLSGFAQGRYATAARISLEALAPPPAAPPAQAAPVSSTSSTGVSSRSIAGADQAANSAAKPAAPDEGTRKEWGVWQTRMKSDFDRAAAFSGGADLQAKAWERFLSIWNLNNPFSTDDEVLRKQAQQRMQTAQRAAQ